MTRQPKTYQLDQLSDPHRLKAAGTPQWPEETHRAMTGYPARRNRGIKNRIRSALSFKSEAAAEITLSGIEIVHIMRKQRTSLHQPKYFPSNNSSRASQ